MPQPGSWIRGRIPKKWLDLSVNFERLLRTIKWGRPTLSLWVRWLTQDRYRNSKQSTTELPISL